MNKLQWEMNSRVGTFFLVASQVGLQGVFWKKQNVSMANNLNENSDATKILADAVKQMEEYLDGKRKIFDLPIDVKGSEFQKKVWNQLSQIPYGETCSYKEIACRINNEKAVRAVGLANSKNPLSIIVPCHRVIGMNGKLTGYAGGLDIKSKLLVIENCFQSVCQGPTKSLPLKHRVHKKF